jgi:hypothetical protein
MNRQKESCTDCIHYSLNGFRPWCKECNKPINQGEVPPCNPDGEKADFLEIRRYLQGCSKL